MKYKIPKIYRDVKIFTIAARVWCKTNWNLIALKKVQKDPEFKNLYYNMKSDSEIYTLLELVTKYDIKLVIDNLGSTEKIGSGKETFLKIRSNAHIIFSNMNFYYKPKGVGQICLTFNDILRSQESSKNSECSKTTLNSKNINNSENIPLTENLAQTGFVRLENKYKVSIDIWTKISKGKNVQFNKLRFGSCKYEKIIELHYSLDSENFYAIDLSGKYFENYFPCKNRMKGCQYYFNTKKKLEVHEQKCSEVQKYKVKQVEYGSDSNLIQKLIDLGHLSKRPRNENFVFYDIECLCPNVGLEIGKSRIVSTHRLLSIAANKYINGKHEKKCWIIENDSKAAQTDIVKKFLDFCREAQSAVEISDELRTCHKMLKNRTKLNKSKNIRHDEIFSMIRILDSFIELPIFGFNSSRYDNNVIFRHIVQCLDNLSNKDNEDTFKTNSMQILKKGTKYFSIKFENLHFKDLLNFTCPMNLDTYLKTWTKSFEKLVYPFEHFSNISELRKCTEFPPRKAFASTVKGDIDENSYKNCLDLFNFHRNLPSDHSEHWNSFERYLEHYNVSDVYPASLGLIKQFSVFEANFGSSPMQFLGLPTFASEAMFNMYDKKCANIFSFSPNSEATKIFREQIIGGLVNVMKRHATLLDEPAAERAKMNKNGTFPKQKIDVLRTIEVLRTLFILVFQIV